MTKQRKSNLTYDQFVEVWEQLINDHRAGNNVAHDILGGSKSTIANFRERYEREKTSKTLSIIKSVELTEAVHQAIADIKVKEIEALEQVKKQLESRVDSYINGMKEAESKLAETLVEFEDAKTNFDIEKLNLERQLAASQARIGDLEKREQKIAAKLEKLNEQYNQAKQETAVAKKEVELLRESAKKIA